MKIRKLIALFILFSIMCSAGFVTHAEQLTSSEGPVDYQLSFEEALSEINARHKAVTKPVFDWEEFKAKYARDKEPRDFQLEIPEGPKTAGCLSVGQMKRDAYVLMYNLRKYYSLYDYYGGDEKFDAVLTEIEEAVTSAGEMDANEFSKFLLPHLSFISDKHFTLNRRNPSPYMITAFYREVAFGKIGGKYVNLETGKEVKRVDGISELDSLFRLSLSDDCRLVYFPIVQISIPFMEVTEQLVSGILTEPADTLHIVYSDNSTQALSGFMDYRTIAALSSVEANIHETQSIPVLRTTQFDKSKQRKLMLDFLDAYRSSPSMVVDLRMNGGGYGWDVLAWFDSYTGRVTSGNRCTVQFGTLESLYEKNRYGSLSSSEKDMLGKRLQAIDGSHVLMDVVLDEFIDNPNRLLIVLTAKHTASASEWFVDYGYNVENVLFVGDASMGCLENSSTYTSVSLTYSHIPISMGTMATVFPDGDYFQEGRGFLPDIWVPATDAEELICGFLQKQQAG